MSKRILVSFSALGIVLVAGGITLAIARPLFSVPKTLPKFITADIVDTDFTGRVSKFRSGAGHDFSGGGERCRSMKHYFDPQADGKLTLSQEQLLSDSYKPTIPVFSPVTGTVEKIVDEQFPLGQQIYLKPDGYSVYTVRLFHIFPDTMTVAGETVRAGQQLGLIKDQQEFDVSVEIKTLTGSHFLSYFEVMNDTVFSSYGIRGITERNQVIISKAERDAHPLTCSGESFTAKDSSDNWVTLNKPGR